MKKIVLKNDDYCFVCSKNNKLGLKLDFHLTDDETLWCEFVTKKEHQGFSGIVHGGIVGLIMDESMVKLLWELGIKVVTSEFTMRLKKACICG